MVGATLGNDVNLRDFEGRSALLLGKAKDNNASCAIGPFIRLFDEHFSMDDVRQCDLALHMQGTDGFAFTGRSSMSQISRDPLEIVEHTIGPNHQYPDGLVLFLGTMFAPTIDRFAPGKGFTHVVGDIVTVDDAAARSARQPRESQRQDRPVDVRRYGVDEESRTARAYLRNLRRGPDPTASFFFGRRKSFSPLRAQSTQSRNGLLSGLGGEGLLDRDGGLGHRSWRQDANSALSLNCSSASGLASASLFRITRPWTTSRTASSTSFPLLVRGMSVTCTMRAGT